jgi:aspartate oxidase
MEWTLSADVVVIGAGAAGLPAAIAARDHGASVILIEENFDIGGHAMLSGGRVQLGGGHALQRKFNIEDSPDQVFLDWVRHDRGDSRYSDRDLIRAFADENVATFDFLIENGVQFIEKPIHAPDAATVPRIFVTKEWHIPSEIRPGAHAGRQRTQEGRADPAAPQADRHRARTPQPRAGPRHHGAQRRC